MPSTQPFGDNLHRLAGLHRLNQADLALVLGLTRQSVHALLAGKSAPSTSTLLRVEEIFGVGSEVATNDFTALVSSLGDEDRFLDTEDRISAIRSQRFTAPINLARARVAKGSS